MGIWPYNLSLIFKIITKPLLIEPPKAPKTLVIYVTAWPLQPDVGYI